MPAQPSPDVEAVLMAALDRRQRLGLLRTLVPQSPALADFSSNDYLGLARSSELRQLFLARLAQLHSLSASSGAPSMSTVSLSSSTSPTTSTSTSSATLPASSTTSISFSSTVTSTSTSTSASSPSSNASSSSSSTPMIMPTLDFSDSPSRPLMDSSSVGTSESYHPYPLSFFGATGSRLLTGSSSYAERLENELAAFHEAPCALLFNSGYDANLSLLGSLCGKKDVILVDQLAHASMHDGIRLSRAGHIEYFKHNDMHHLQTLLAEQRKISSTAVILIAVESVYSMDGDLAPLRTIVELADLYHAQVIVDEAHATGIYGAQGRGLVSELGLAHKIFARVHTFGKSLACHGAVILGSATLRSYLINYARPLIYSTAMSDHHWLAVECAYEIMKTSDAAVIHLHALIEHFRMRLRSLPGNVLLPSSSPIQGVVVSGNAEVTRVCRIINAAGFDVKPIRSPTVPVGTERLRVCLHAHNTFAEVDGLTACILRLMNDRAGGVAMRTATTSRL